MPVPKIVLRALLGACLLTGSVAVAAPARAAEPAGIRNVTADAETVPVGTNGDSADDPAIWVNTADPARSIVIGNDKGDALEVYDLAGNRLQRIAEAHGNVDVRRGFPLGAGSVDIAAATRGGLRIYRVNPSTRTLTNVTDGGTSISTNSGEGLCMYRSPTSNRFYVFQITRAGAVQQWWIRDVDSDGLVDATLVRSFSVGSESEGCVADDGLGHLYISEEDVGIWKYGAEPGDGSARSPVDSVGSTGKLVADAEGLTIVYQPDGAGFLLASAQNVANPTANYYTVYRREGGNAFVDAFRITSGPAADGCSRTDGIDAVAADLGPSFPSGLFVCQDDKNTTPGGSGSQDFKFVRLEKILTGIDPGPGPGPDTIPPQTTITAGPTGTVTSSTASFSFTADEPATFVCTLDGVTAGCTSPRTYTGLADGPHHFEVAATDTALNPDTTPATRDWTVDTTTPPPASGTIATLAGTGAGGFSGDGGQATSAQLRAPRTTAVDAAGTMFVADTENHRIRRISTAGFITTIAGTGTAGFSGDGGPATSAQLHNPHGIAVDGAGNVYVADSPNHRIRRITPAGVITTVAGTGSTAYNGDGIAATSASLAYPKGVEVAPDGSLYVGDANHHRVRRFTVGGTISTVAGIGVAGFAGDGGQATAARLNFPRNVAFGSDGSFYVADDENFRVRRVSPTGVITTVAGTGVSGFSGDGGPATSAQMRRVRDVAVDSAGNLYVADQENHRIRRVSPTGVMSTFAGTGTSGFSGDGGAPGSAKVAGPRGVTVAPSGAVLIADTGNHRIRRVT